MSSIIECLDDLLVKAQSIAELKNTSQVVFSPEDLVKIIKGTSVPAVGIVYEGMQGLDEEGSTKKGMGVTAAFGLYLAVDATQITHSIYQNNVALNMLVSMRKALGGQRAPGGHFWQFMSEGYADSFPGRTLWIQKWNTKLMGIS